LRELDDRNSQDSEIKQKICKHCECPKEVSITRTALQDLGLIPQTKDAVLNALKEHIELKRRVFTEKMDNGDTAYIVPDCPLEGECLYIKVKFLKKGDTEKMLIISAHPPRKW
jgi:hypothetical protein